MPTRVIAGVAELKSLVGQEIGVSDWFEISQSLIDAFAELTHDWQWIHCDADRAKKDSPVGQTIAHGFLTMALLSHLKAQVAKIEGADPKLKDEYVIYSAHWDHLGRNPKLPGDQVYNGALDNASGTAALLELAEAFTKVRPKRTVLFLSVTAEEKGLLGAKYYVTHPLYPLEHTLGNINIDGINVWGRTRDIGLVGVGQSTMEDLLQSFATAQGRKVVPEAEPEKGYYYRSDHFEFAKVGVPALYTDRGTDYLGKPADFGKRKREEYIANDYHKVSDEIKPDWDLSGAVEDLRLLFQVGYAVAQGDSRPEWKSGSEFKKVRR